MSDFKQQFDRRVWAVVAAIPRGQVMAYGEVARAAGYPRYSRMVSGALGRSPEPLPWHRVVKSDRKLAFAVGSDAYREQSQLLAQEGIKFDGTKIIAEPPVETLDRMLWGPQD